MTAIRTQLAIVASPEVIEEITQATEGVAFSAPVAVESPADALDSPVGGAEIQQLAEMVVLIAQSGAATLTIVNQLRDLLKNRRDEAAAAVADPESGKRLGTITAETSDEDIDRMARQ